MQSAEKPATPPKNKNPWKTAAFASNYQSNTEGGGVLMRLECESEENKNEWVKAINSEVKQLRSIANNISDQR